MDIANLWTLWPVSGPWQLSALPGGTNNVMWRVDTPSDQSYVLRLSDDLTLAPRLRYESRLLQALAEANPPFRLPVPLPATNGDSLVQFEQEPGREMLATLAPFLSGEVQDQPPARHDLSVASHAASALAWLDQTLATLPPVEPPADYISLPTFGELAHWHPLVSDPLTALELLPINNTQARELRTILTQVQEDVPSLYARLPQQLLHRDFDPGNVLVNQDGVTAILDFEFAANDIRIIDLSVALSWWPVYLLGSGTEWDLIDAFGSAYVEKMALSTEELCALPSVLRLRDATSLVHRIGRYLAGMESETRIQRRVEHSLWREAWLSSHQQTLVDHALAWLN